VAIIKDADPQMRSLGVKVVQITDETILKVATAFYQSCQFQYEPTFFAWRKKIAEFRA